MEFTEISNGDGDKYEWQKKLISFIYNVIGLITIQARTGVGKTEIPFMSMLNDSKKYKCTRFLVPNNQSHLVEQHGERLQKYCNKKNYKYSKLKSNSKECHFCIIITINEEKKKKLYKFYIQTFCSFTDSASYFLSEFKDEAIYIDEIHMIQTQFGLRHAGAKYAHSASNLKSINSANEREHGKHFSILESLCKQNKVVFMSATLDDISCNELLPYQNKFSMKHFVVTHKKESFNKVIVKYRNSESMIEKLISNAKEGIKTFVYFGCGDRLNEVNKILSQNGISKDDIYSWTYKNDEIFKVEKIKVISLFINKGTTGIDVLDLKNIFIFRKLSDKGSSSRNDEDMISNLSQQIIGRLRTNGEVYWENDDIKDDDNLYDLTNKNFQNPLSETTKKSYQDMKIISEKELNSDIEANFSRLFIYKYIKNGYDYNARGMPSKNRSVIKEFHESFEKECLEMNNIINKNQLLENIDKYHELEQKMINLYQEIYESINDNIKVFDPSSRTTGGGKSKPNISKAEEEKGIKCMQEAIQNCQLEGNSWLYVADKTKDDPHYGFMHAINKCELNDIERTKSCYAIPMLNNSQEMGLNAKEGINNNILYWKNNEININYQELLKELKYNNISIDIVNTSLGIRSEKHIKQILKEYSRLQNEKI